MQPIAVGVNKDVPAKDVAELMGELDVGALPVGSAEAMETIAHGVRGGKVVGRPIEDIKLPEGAKIVPIVRGDRVVMAHHDTVIENGDHVILFLSDKRHVEQVERLFQT